ncbi:hypothetical protein [Ureibacillus sinduriensis]|uniref:hypothetical protein n=1 Tax=Ureibacillus sinduriensis TaxID=561440 RepID=UPI000559FACF|nr:hypothetical protein [Ureibacillus sinduriensis]
MQNEKYTISGTDIEEVKRKNAESGLSYKEVLEHLAKTGGSNTKADNATMGMGVKNHNEYPN